MKNEQLGIRILKELKKKLQKLADGDKRTLSNYIEIVLNEHVEKLGEK